ncbi:MAG: glucuronate isomerase [Pyrinomonadaceae bacterium]|nr:glucuronate isomerase [Pyrinomonadaceae bacterium]
MLKEKNDQQSASDTRLTDSTELRQHVLDVVNKTPVVDIHTHLYAPEFGAMNLFGIDELLTYHYLVAEMFRSSEVTPEVFWSMDKAKQADIVWETLFVRNTPLSEATRGVVTALAAFNLDANAPNLKEAREFFRGQSLESHLDRNMTLASVSDVVMTNDPFDDEEVKTWEAGGDIDKRFHAALRMDRLLNDWANTSAILRAQGYAVETDARGRTVDEARRFLDKWIARMKPLYMAVSLPDDFMFPDGDVRDRMIREVVLPVSREHRLPFALMIGVRRKVNPALRVAGDGLGRADIRAVEHLCVENPDVRFLVTMLSRENQHELCVAARKFSNLLPFGCWWFLNNPSIVSEITRERLELLGPSFIPQHSDARVLEQLIYKWGHSREVSADVLGVAYEKLLRAGRAVTRNDIERDVARMFSGNFCEWVGLERIKGEQPLD